MFKRSNILFMADKAAHEDIDIGEFLSTGTATVFRTKRTFVEEGLEVVLDKDGRPGASRLLSALLVSIACSEPPDGRCRWTLQLLADRFVTWTDFDDESIERKGIKTVAEKNVVYSEI